MRNTIISASRRTDIPAYYSDWLVKKIHDGGLYYQNPMSKQPVWADLSPEKVRAFIFWTRNPKPLFPHLPLIDEVYDKKHYMHITINGLPADLERRNPKIEFAIDMVKYLCDRYGPEYVQWRFDPITITNICDEDYHVLQFEYIIKNLNKYIRRCYFSFVDLYKKTQSNLNKMEQSQSIKHKPLNLDEQIVLILRMKEIADSYNISLHSCAEDAVMEKVPGIFKAHCVDPELIIRLENNTISNKQNYKPSRIGCGCIESKDIGYYDSCPHGCIYCYANMDPEAALKNAQQYRKEGFPFDGMAKGNLKNDQKSSNFANANVVRKIIYKQPGFFDTE